MPGRPRSHDVSPDSHEYVEAWARDLVATAGKREARRLLDHYRALADDPRVTKHGREIATERVEILEKLL